MVTKTKREIDQKPTTVDLPICFNSVESSVTIPKSILYNDRAKAIRNFIEKCIQNRKIFSVFGPYESIRSGLYRRGWLEKKYTPISKKKIVRVITKLQNADISDDDTGDECFDLNSEEFDFERDCDVRVIASWLLRRIVPNFIWTRRRLSCNRYATFQKEQIFNHFTSADFTSKVGLNSCLQDAHWFGEDVRTFYPRSYCIGQHEEKMAFIDDFRLSACLSILKWIIINMGDGNNSLLPDDDRMLLKGPLKIINIALAQCERFLLIHAHQDLDNDLDDPLSPEQWDALLKWYYLMAEDRVNVNRDDAAYRKCHQMLIRVKPYCPQLDVDGYSNVWIVKPGAKSRGVGIKLLDKLTDILNLVDSEVTKSTKYIVQKYIERPLLIYNTKFDIRQWFLVTDWNPLTIYMYKDCYLRFCSQSFSLKNKIDAVHLCNNAIQRKYIKRSEPRRDNLPLELMWACEDFRSYLTSFNKQHVWFDIIFPGMKRAIITAMLCAQESIEYKKGSFELFGADFMVTEDFRPWLIEVNASPCVAPSTEITARMCTRMLDDVLKVIIDRAENKDCRTGLFEMVYKEPMTPNHKLTCPTFAITGFPIFPPQSWIDSNNQVASKLELIQNTCCASEESEGGGEFKVEEENVVGGQKEASRRASGSPVENEDRDFFKVEQLFGENENGSLQNQMSARKRKTMARETSLEDEIQIKMKRSNDNRSVNESDRKSSRCSSSVFSEPGTRSNSVTISPVYDGGSSEIMSSRTDSQFSHRRCHSERSQSQQQQQYEVNSKWLSPYGTDFQMCHDTYYQENPARFCFPVISPRSSSRVPSSEKAMEEFSRSPPMLVYSNQPTAPVKKKRTNKAKSASKIPEKDDGLPLFSAEMQMEKFCKQFVKRTDVNAMREDYGISVKSSNLGHKSSINEQHQIEKTSINEQHQIEKTPKIIKYKVCRKQSVNKRAVLPTLKVVNLTGDITDTKPLGQEQQISRPNSSDLGRRHSKMSSYQKPLFCNNKLSKEETREVVHTLQMEFNDF